MIDFLDSDPNVFRGEFDGNRWQGLGVPWMECLPAVEDCLDRLESGRSDKLPGCSQCDSRLRSEEVHFHAIEDDNFVTLCDKCWSKGPLPEEDRL